jgi:glucose-1-phosphate thymidylyltransferase
MHTLGIILAGGRSTRLYPATLATTKQLLPVFDKPLIYYPLSALMLQGIRDYVIIVTPTEKERFEILFANAYKELGINIIFAIQDMPAGIPDAFNIAASTVDVFAYEKTALILGDNIFYGSYLSKLLSDASADTHPTIVLKRVSSADANRFGIAKIDPAGELTSLVEKPMQAERENWAITGLYFYPQTVYFKARTLVPSSRGELEITDLNNLYLAEEQLKYVKLLRGMVWFDTGSPESLLDAANLIKGLQDQGIAVGNVHEIAYNNKWISRGTLQEVCRKLRNSSYGKYLYEEVL